jgi:hypothetical protein
MSPNVSIVTSNVKSPRLKQGRLEMACLFQADAAKKARILVRSNMELSSAAASGSPTRRLGHGWVNSGKF